MADLDAIYNRSKKNKMLINSLFNSDLINSNKTKKTSMVELLKLCHETRCRNKLRSDI